MSQGLQIKQVIADSMQTSRDPLLGRIFTFSTVSKAGLTVVVHFQGGLQLLSHERSHRPLRLNFYLSISMRRV